MGDSYPDGDPNGNDIRAVIRAMVDKVASLLSLSRARWPPLFAYPVERRTHRRNLQKIDYTTVRAGPEALTAQYAAFARKTFEERLAEIQQTPGRMPIIRDMKLETAAAAEFLNIVVTESLRSVMRGRAAAKK